ncbi:MAG: glycosyltransferase [Candidatus Marinimicrobia bacterium]|nr:glycosyltransferase [Candidatus Neomarinimicrobiota bacterium]
MNKNSLSSDFIDLTSHSIIFSHNNRLNGLSISAPQRMLEEDIRNLENNYYSHRLFCSSEVSIVLDIDANSGIFPIYFASLGKNIHVLTVETRQNLFINLKETIEKSSLSNISCFQSLDEALSAARDLCHKRKKYIDLIKMGRVSFDLKLLKQIGQEFEIGHLCGEFIGHDRTALDVYRLSSGSANSFFWQNLTKENQLSGYGNKDIEVSVVVPVYNVEKYLPKCIESLVNQTIKSKEILLVYDGSTDSSGCIADEWSKTYPEIRVIHQQNAGCAAARSKGLSEARGKFVGFVDSDDWVDAEMFEKLFEAAVTNNAEVAECGFRKVYKDNNMIEPFYEEVGFKAFPYSSKVIDDVLDIMVSIPSIWRRIYSTVFLKGNGIDFLHTLPRFDDLPFQFEVFMHTNKMVSIPGIFYNYRLGRMGQDVALKDERLYVHFDIFKHLREKMAIKPRIEFERQLKRVEIATHEWALLNIEDHLKRKYQIMAAKDLFNNRLMISRIRILKDAMKESKIKGAKIFVALILSLIMPKK